MMIGKAIRKVVFLAVLAVLLLVVVRFWEQIVEYLFYFFGLGAVGYGVAKGTEKLQEIREEIRDQEEKLDQATDVRQKQAEILAREDEKQQEAIEDWRERKNRWKSRIGLMLIFCVLLIAASPARAEVDSYADLTREELIEMIVEAEKLLDEADQLLARETSLKEEYKRLYLEAEADLRAAKELSLQKDEIIMDQAREIEFLRYRLERKKRAWGLSAGTIITGQTASWTLGVSRRRGSLSWTLAVAGAAGGDSFGVGAGVTVWW